MSGPTPDELESFRRVIAFREESKSPRLRTWPYVSLPVGDRKIVGVFDGLIEVAADATYADAALVFLRHILGDRWLRIQYGEPVERQHVIVQWMRQLERDIRAAGEAAGIASGPVKVTPTGGPKALTVLADDVFQLGQVMHLPIQLVERLKTRRDFHSSWYEISTASLFARAGFNVEFIPPGSESSPEFVATDRKSGESLFLEAKSIHRAGVLHEAAREQPTDSVSNRKRVIKQLRGAIKQNPGGRPFVVHIDLNMPAIGAATYLDQHFMFDVQRYLERRRERSPDGLSDVTAVVLTKCGWYYSQGVEPPPDGTFMLIRDPRPRHALSDEAWSRLDRAVGEYGWVPDEELHKREVASRYPDVAGR